MKKKIEVEKKNKVNSFTVFLVYVQGILALITLVAFVMYIFNKDMYEILQFCLGITLLFMAFLSSRIYKKSKFTILCLIFGLLLILFNLLRVVGVF